MHDNRHRARKCPFWHLARNAPLGIKQGIKNASRLVISLLACSSGDHGSGTIIFSGLIWQIAC
ncbi:hypothetical protein CSC3H3_18065 [Thalassospira marina]|uniref:Uncharacterized protein n=1 Tax=Thalassospira marina TaxID=2048283 RepID=A0ABM6QCV0_9PROT|nr:hypothetical protein CSC3H3_18065 [Thalassospira marina]